MDTLFDDDFVAEATRIEHFGRENSLYERCIDCRNGRKRKNKIVKVASQKFDSYENKRGHIKCKFAISMELKEEGECIKTHLKGRQVWTVVQRESGFKIFKCVVWYQQEDEANDGLPRPVIAVR